ncbi:hypothetical protein [Paenibacillus sp. YN15]|uniref:hypothetical protein n=1 Tax=Paenibacillus sp. YN15 TaxID=1742774 RepID=UPI0015EBCF89|nr:hypothetical protein [Paenibacillus sp. YN15]
MSMTIFTLWKMYTGLIRNFYDNKNMIPQALLLSIHEKNQTIRFPAVWFLFYPSDNSAPIAPLYSPLFSRKGVAPAKWCNPLRTGSRGYLQSDPYTVMMANVNWSPNNSSGGKYYFSGNDPMIVYPSKIANAFGKNFYVFN